MAYKVELTDTFGGEANYSWVRRATIESREPTPDNVYTSAVTIAKEARARRRDIMRRAKAAVGLTGVRGRTNDFGDMIEFRPYGLLEIMFVTWTDESEESE